MPGLTKAGVFALIKENEESKIKATEEQTAVRQALAGEMKELVTTEVAAALASLSG